MTIGSSGLALLCASRGKPLPSATVRLLTGLPTETMTMRCRTLAVLVLFFRCCFGALNVDVGATHKQVSELRDTIFIDSAYLTPRTEDRCSSLDGPRCFSFMIGKDTAAEHNGLGALAPGVIPEVLLQSLGSEANAEFSTPEYSDLEVLRRKLELLTQVSKSPRAVNTGDLALVRNARHGAQHGAVHFADLSPDHRLPLTFSRGMPGHVVATWDGKWVVRTNLQCNSESTTSGMPSNFLLPTSVPRLDHSSPDAVVLSSGVGRAASQGSANDAGVAAVAELGSSVGYLRFSHAVVVRAMYARWSPKAGSPPAVIAGRLGLQPAWTTHLDPERFTNSQEWFEVTGGSLQPVDEVVFAAMQGLELGALWVVAHNGDYTDGGSERTMVMLQPVPSTAKDRSHGQPQFVLAAKQLSPAATPFAISLREAIDKNLRLNMEPTQWSLPHSHGTALQHLGLLTTERVDTQQWTPSASLNQEMLEHRLISHQLGLSSLAVDAMGIAQARKQSSAPKVAQHIERLVDAFGRHSHSMPADLQKAFKAHQQGIREALHGWAHSGGGWHHKVPLSFPHEGTEEAVQRYMLAKTWQTKLDLLTVAFLYQQPHHVDKSRHR
mmetsp:Transcript_50534/g.97680  ORF Transcript_50534/g.97680 Transcript_50534/m.97680 type:complete len:607 (-) Transcript_50534:99-1919(-)